MSVELPPRDRIRAGLALLVLSASACTNYTIRTTLDPDGGGRRAEVLEVTRDSKKAPPMTPEAFVEIMNLEKGAGWSHEVRAGRDTTHVFRRERSVRDLAGWSGLDGTVELRGSTRATADIRVGQLRVGDVRFLNRVHVDRRPGPSGSHVYSYRESFFWEQGAAPVIERVALSFADTVASRFGPLAAESRGEVAGIVTGGLWAAVDQGLLSDDRRAGISGDTLESRLLRRTAVEVARIVRPDAPETVRTTLESLLRRWLEGDDSWLDRWIDRVVPGFNQADRTQIEFRLSMPGHVTASNADEVEGDTLVWSFKPHDAFARPVEVEAESRM